MNEKQSIFQKIKEQLSLSNKYFYWSTFVFLIAILTSINNYYFYSHVDRSSKRDVRQLKIILEEQIQYCKKKAIEVDECNELLKLTIINFGKYAFYNDKLIINGEIIPKEKEMDDKVVKSDINISLLQNNKYEGYEYHSGVIFDKYLYLHSIFRSMTFSITDIMNITYNDGLKKALESFDISYFYRSRPVLGFAIFTYLILWFSRRRTFKLEEQRKSDLEEFDRQIEIATQNQVDILTKQNKLEEEYKSVCEQFKQYESFVKFAFEDISIDELLERNRKILGNIFRRVAEKIVYSIYENNIGQKIQKKDNLDSCLKEIKSLNILSKQGINSLYSVKNFGNYNSHYSKDGNETSFVKTIVIAKDLIEIIEEYLSLESKSKNLHNVK